MVKLKPHPIAALFPMIEGTEWDAFLADIKTNGLREPIDLLNGQILDGRNRYRACVELAISPRTRELPAATDPWAYVWSLNAARRHVDAGQKAALWLKFSDGSTAWLAERGAAAVKANAARTRGRGKSGRFDPPSVAPVPPTVARASKDAAKTRTSAARAAGVSPRTMQDAISLRAMAPEAFDRVAEGDAPLKKEIAGVKLAEKRALAAKLDAAPVPLVNARFAVIVIDPPWKYDSRAEDPTHRARNPYPDMTVDDICALPLAKLAQPDCILWLWTTNAFMREAFRCLDAWGFHERTILTWVKDRIGTGDWLRGQTEHCIVASRGKPVLTLTNQSTALSAPMRQHSRKPDEFFALVESLCHGLKLEMFAREPRDGWQRWGAETGKFHAE